MRVIALAILFAATPAWGQPAGTNHLSPEEVRDGWVLLFDGSTTFGWTTKGDVRVEDGRILLGDSKASVTYQADLPPSAELTFEIQGRATVGLGDRHGDGMNVIAQPLRDPWMPVRARAQIAPPRRLLQVWLGSAKEPIEEKTMGKNKAVRYEPIHLTLTTPHRAEVRSIKMRPLDTKPLFNGKDLAGWKIFPGKKSEFTVADGSIHIKNGPGDLQTEGKYQDFWLQFECKSNGKALNSGVFFRCREGEYQNGYEAQVQNDFSKDPPREYDVEVYDPKTHKLFEKRKMLSAAADFGTGAIYRRIPARTSVAKDGEWFTMTVAAHGNHIATWVNGVQQVDWYDNRPPSDNARNGFRREGGHLSLQGHDPTTDLSFRNFRIAELPSDR